MVNNPHFTFSRDYPAWQNLLREKDYILDHANNASKRVIKALKEVVGHLSTIIYLKLFLSDMQSQFND